MRFNTNLSVYSLLAVLLFFYPKLYAGIDIQKVGVPFIENYTKSQYKAANQNWAITQDEHNIIYVANNEGLLTFDGSIWKHFEANNKIILRAVAADGKGKVFTGGFEDFGYWHYDSKGILRYKSLTPLLPKGVSLTDEIWKIYIDGHRVLFQSFSKIFIYENGKIKTVDDKEAQSQPYLFLHKVGRKFFVEVINRGLYELKGNKILPINGSEFLGQTGILSMLPFENQKILIGTAKNGLFLYDGSKFEKWENKADDYLKTYQLNNGVKVFEDYYAFGTILKGVVILDKEGNVVQQIEKSNGLQNNTILGLLVDKEQNLWCALDNGIDRIEINSPLYFYLDKSGKFGTIYSSIIHNGYIYLGTNQGLFYSSWIGKDQKKQSFEFNLVKNSQGQVWDLSVFDNNLICGHNTGTYLVNGTELEKISPVNGGWFITRSNLNPEILIQGTYTGLVTYKRNPQGKFEMLHRLTGFSGPLRYVQQDDKGYLWVSHVYKGVFKLKLSADYSKVTEFREYGINNGLPSDYKINIFNLNGRIVFSTDKGFYIYDEIDDNFHNYSQLNSKLGSFSKSNKIIKADGNQYWFIRKGNISFVDFGKPGQLDIDSNMFRVLKDRMFRDYENVNKINNDFYLISIDDGFVVFNKADQIGKGEKLPKVIIGQMETTGNAFSIISNLGLLGRDITINNRDKNIRINYSLPYYKLGDIKYQYALDGYSSQWSEWSNQAQKDFTNLPSGDYVFKVRAKFNEQLISGVSELKFTIQPPFYATKLAFLIYIILLIFIAFYLSRWYKKNLIRHQQKIEERMQREKEEQLKEESIINEQKLIKLKAEKLEAELMSKAREATNSAMNIVYKNELLQKIREEIQELKDENGKKLSEDQLRRIQKVIDEGMTDERDWDLFEKSFNGTHENFFHKLKVNHPDLVPNDLKLCAYLRMNMSSKEMASLLNITLRGVEIRRYRLRKKLQVPHDKNLVEFLMEL
ncbi:Two component regulator three Y domain-containing protein [Pseudopedobacter saltans DSM 12145]|uniref:Two component regulator three Y domain-containing protein n=1 Tax=Pseudopedobacter saltans (strain ATCC 51119 / DSM 12145 / JCM 21818 / CCUG 39354 / LMG 10337 / NBRC 100064 / NCIMB 13643) TaxID=762903 RepID=F0SBN5_PSESL|nr:triple tyrosine motif-containing protein [Pseudopedobacter saltans]ADY52726.1 Two component regulator three Y domain-containing protein [Pseudopedobacter saltans DSM 12145]